MDGGGRVSSNGSLSTVSKEDNLVMVSSEVSSSYPDESELELGLGLSLGCGGGGSGGGGGRGSNVKSKPWGQGGGRILTAQDFPSATGSKAVSSSSSSSSPTATKAIGNTNSFCGTKRSADSFSPPRSGVSQVVGWPPVRAYRMNSLINQAKSPASEFCTLTNEKSKNKSPVFEKNDGIMNRKNNDGKAKDFSKSSHFVKVYMEGTLIGRKVDLNAHNSYETLARALDDMFCTPSNAVGTRTSYTKEQGGMIETVVSLRLLDEASDFVLTYEDKDGDWMLVGDVPWEMFIMSVKKLKIMKTSEAKGLASGCQLRSKIERTQPVWT